MNHISIKDVFSQGWANTKKHLAFLSISTFIYFVVHLLLVGFDKDSGNIFLSLAAMAVGIIYSIGMIRIGLKVESGAVPTKDDFKVGINIFFIFLWASIISGFFTVLGFILLIVPGIIVGIRLTFVKYVVIDKNLSGWQSVKVGWAQTKGHFWKILGFVILSGLIVLVSLIPFGLGLLISVPFVTMSFAVFYRKLSLLPTTAQSTPVSSSEVH